jgi:hypothetical protein
MDEDEDEDEDDDEGRAVTRRNAGDCEGEDPFAGATVGSGLANKRIADRETSPPGAVLPAPAAARTGRGRGRGRRVVLSPDLLFALAVAGMENAEEGPGVTLDEIGMLRDELTGRLEALGPGEAAACGGRRGGWTRTTTRAGRWRGGTGRRGR